MSQMNVLTYPGATLDTKEKKVFFEGSTAITKGYGCAYNRDTGTAATAEQKRSTNVEVLTYANAADFAGVFLESKPAVAGGQLVSIATPGSDCFVYTSETSLTVNSGRIHCRADATTPGVFVNKAGIKGPGSAVPLQTITAAGLVLVHLDEGDQNGCVEILTVTAGGATNMMARGGTTCFATATVASDATFTLAAGTFIGQIRSFQVEGTLTTSDVDISATIIAADGSTAYTHWKGDADAEDLNVVWNGTAWIVSQAGTGAYS